MPTTLWHGKCHDKIKEVKTKIDRRHGIMKKLTTLFITALMVTGLTTSAFAAGPAGNERGRDDRESYRSETVRGGFQGRYERGRNVHHGRHVYNRAQHSGYGRGWGHHDRYGHGWGNHGGFGHGWGR